MTDPRPRPQYGEYADMPPVSPPPAGTAEPVDEAPPARTRRWTWDIVLTTGLLLWGVVDVVRGFPEFARLGDALAEAYEAQGLPAFGAEGLADQVGGLVNVARLVILVVAISGSLLLIARGRRAFWVPLSAGVLAAIIVAIAVIVIVVLDPAFSQYVTEQTTR